MERRCLGETGEKLSIIGLGGVVLDGMKQEEADRVVAEAVDRGVNYFDVAPRYGSAEERLGPALKTYRDKVFLACKTAERGRENSARELEASLWYLQTDHFDLYQLHALEPEDLDKVFSPGGAMETLLAAKEAGKIRFIGFSSHSVEAALAALEQFSFDTVLFPVNFVCWLSGFGPQVVEAARAHNTARLAIKGIARSPWPEGAERKWQKEWYQPLEKQEEIELALRFTLSQDITATVGPGEPPLFRMALEAAEKFRPLEDDEMQRLRALADTLVPLFAAT
ncbi:MAG: aldo/keto reductase [Armatimonadetes bacterium]|nr:aldo/keto reductase [Armatimonadota bacterium]NIM23488.1 aldo/keto reductase [Armatimonadota bacterium]NIM67354.1 aldo/keto reductase [Armatimonadota bacterium]NIM75855.1 aldo/keto reductase [Armatimonadota bacterium]NIN05540.1 aldo/keto reductase [Armatimonadota bacterium]